MVFDGLRDVGGQRAGVADAGGAAVADGIETECVEVRGEAGFVVVVGDDAGAGGEGSFDPRRRAEALLDGLLREQAGGDHDVGVGGVGAGGDGGDDDGAVVEIGVGIDAEAGFDGGGRGGVWVGCAETAFVVAVGGGVAAFGLPAEDLAGGGLVAIGAEQGGELLGEAGGGLREKDAILRALGAGDAGLDGGEIQGQGGRVLGFGRRRVWKSPCSRK